ncbi:hypothetical protein ACS0TY_024842 [Phlomoides rotata]
MFSVRSNNEIVYLLLEEIIHDTLVICTIILELIYNTSGQKRKCGHEYSMIDRIPDQVKEMNRLVMGFDSDCHENLRMDRNAFGRLCYLLRNIGGLSNGKFVSVEEQVAMFLSILAHHKKNKVVKFKFLRSGQTVSHYVHLVLGAVLQLHGILLAKPVPIPDDCTDPRWKWFKVYITFDVQPDYISSIESTNEWTGIRDELAHNIWADWNADMDSTQPTPVMGKGNAKKTNCGLRRMWTTREERVLINALKDLVLKGQKTDNGFRTGYLMKLETALRVAFPTTDLQANPHIVSKLTTWKRSYGSLMTALSTTGVGHNTMTNQLDCTDELWEVVVKKDPAMRGMRYKEWPLYPDWIEIFGRDRATGEVAEDILDAAKLAQSQSKNHSLGTNQDFNGENNVNTNDIPYGTAEEQPLPGEQEVNNTAYNTREAQISGHAGKKRKVGDNVNEQTVAELLRTLCKATGDRLETIASRIGYDHDLGQSRKQLFEQLGKIPDLTTHDKLDLSLMLGAKTECLEIFMGLPDDARTIYAMRLLGRPIYNQS